MRYRKPLCVPIPYPEDISTIKCLFRKIRKNKEGYKIIKIGRTVLKKMFRTGAPRHQIPGLLTAAGRSGRFVPFLSA
jgi:hypothetical protein